MKTAKSKSTFTPYVVDLRGGKHSAPVQQRNFNSVWFAMAPVMDKIINMVKPKTCLDLIGGGGK